MSATPNDRCAILSCGNELVLGLICDTNAAFLCRELLDTGWTVAELGAVGDDDAQLVAALRRLTAEYGLIIMTGGLGPTEDDRTRYALAAAAGVGLVENLECVAELERRFREMNRPLHPVNLIQAQLPAGASPLPNPQGTAPGIRLRIGQCEIFALPGVPREMTAMFRDAVRPALTRPGKLYRRLDRVHFLGLGEGTLGALIRERMVPGANPLLGTNVREGVISVNIQGTAESEAAVTELNRRCADELKTLFADHYLGEGPQTLADVLVAALRERGASLALAESCTGGLAAAAVVDVPGASDVFRAGFVTYANEAKRELLDVPEAVLAEHGAVSAPTAAALARGARARTGATYAGAVTGVAGPGGGSAEKPVGTVWFALAGPAGVCYTRQRFLGDRNAIRARAANYLLDLVRRAILNLPLPEGTEFERH